MKRSLLVICAAAALFGAAAHPAVSADDEPLPEGTVTVRGFPPLAPHDPDDVEAVRLWCDRCLAHAEHSHSAVRTADLLMSAGWELGGSLGERERAAALLEEAAALYPAGDAQAGAAWLQAAWLHLARKDYEAADRALAEARRYQGGRASINASQHELDEWSLLHQLLARQVPRVATALAESRGAFAKAATELEAQADRKERARHDPDETGTVWASAARQRVRAGDREKALDDVDRALALVHSERLLAEWTMWRLCCEHGLLDEEGAPSLYAAWPGDAFVQDAYAALRSLQGNSHAAKRLLSLGSRALLAGEPEASLGFYRIALNDPVLLEAARMNESLWRGLLAAFPVAVQLGEFVEAHRILDVIEGTGAVTREEIDGYRLAIARAEEADALAKEAAKAAVPEDRESAPPPPTEMLDPTHPDRGRLRPDAPDEHRRPSIDERANEGRSPVRILGAAALVLLLLVVLYAMARRRR